VVDACRSILERWAEPADLLVDTKLVRRRYQRGPNQSVRAEVSSPLGVGDVGLACGHRFGFAGVDQRQREMIFEQVVERLPVGAGGPVQAVHHGAVTGQPGHDRWSIPQPKLLETLPGESIWVVISKDYNASKMSATVTIFGDLVDA